MMWAELQPFVVAFDFVTPSQHPDSVDLEKESVVLDKVENKTSVFAQNPKLTIMKRGVGAQQPPSKLFHSGEEEEAGQFLEGHQIDVKVDSDPTRLP